MIIVLNKFKKVADFCFELFRIARLPLHFSKFSNKIYSNFQKLFMLVYRQYRRFTYEDLLTDIADNYSLRVYLGLNKLPEYTTLVKFNKKLPNFILEKLVLAFKILIPKPKKVAIDSTGISLDNASPHYCKRIGLPYAKRPFMKTSFIVDIENYIILLCKQRKKRRHDTIDAKPMIKKLAENYEPEVFYGDRGYDDEEIFRLIFEELQAYPLILQRRIEIPTHKRKGEYRKKTHKQFDYAQYLERNKVETTNSIYKRRFGSTTKSRHIKHQKVDIILRVIAHNIDRLIRKGKRVLIIIIKITRVSY